MSTLGIIGAGAIGTRIAQRAIDAGIDVVLANSRGPETLTGTIAELGPRARAATPEEAARAGDWVVVSILPLAAYQQLPAAELAGKVVLDTGNYYATRDGHVPALDAGELTTSEYVQQQLPGAHLVKAFNNLSASHISALARPAGAADRTALPIAGDDPRAKSSAAELISRLGFDTVDVGPLAESWRFEPETDPYTLPYCADPDAMRAAWEQFVAALRSGTAPQPPAADPGAAPLPAARLRSLLAGTPRTLTADRLIA
ncbi:NADP oxidoreductase [Actinoplanes awajinensis subsp. mycoplanecinus]|uniref:NADP oxidoreductase n=2 Tax=Actinoplanes awajinensis TaxID=135946 RepID=A0A117MQW9_9ACTN|nr:NADPH-dependent F420 reductase [Actinoplanes awajinensis]KUL30864.1 NADP oxidoreductase [Actinoplanes awajinensis subsp. mycoplanecinus]